MTQPIENNPTWQAGYAAGWAAYGDLMIEQLGPDGMVWRPIETAPSSGEVLLYCEDTDEQFVAFLGTCIEDGSKDWVFARAPDVSFIVRDPTHWMPLPKPPMTSARKEAA